MLRIFLQFMKTLKTGEVSVAFHGKKAVKLRVEDGNVEVNLKEVEGLSIFNLNEKPKKTDVFEIIKKFRGLAEELRRENLTVNINIQNKPLLTLGAGANPKISRLITFSTAIEIKSLRGILETAKKLTADFR